MTIVDVVRPVSATPTPPQQARGVWRLLVATAVAVAALAAVPSLVSPFTLILVTQTLVYCLLAVSLQLLWGHAGQLSFGQAAFFGIGAYAYAIVGTRIERTGWLGLHEPGWLPLAAGILVPTLTALLLGYFLYFGAVRGAYFSIVTLAVVVIANQITVSWRDVTGGDTGLTRVPSLELPVGGFVLDLSDRVTKYDLAAALLVVGVLVSVVVRRSRFGLVLAAIREDENRVLFLGYNTSWYLTAVLTLSGAMAGLAGTAWAATSNTAAPDVLGPVLSIEILAWVAVGGRGYIAGAIAGTVLIRLLNHELSGVMPDKWPLFIGIFFVLVVMTMPSGLLGACQDLTRRVVEARKQRARRDAHSVRSSGTTSKPHREEDT